MSKTYPNRQSWCFKTFSSVEIISLCPNTQYPDLGTNCTVLSSDLNNPLETDDQPLTEPPNILNLAEVIIGLLSPNYKPDVLDSD